MVPLLFAGLLLLSVWAWWNLYIVDYQGQPTVSLMLRVREGEEYLDPLLRMICQLFRHTIHIKLEEIWVLAEDEGEQAQAVVKRLNDTFPFFHFRPLVGGGQVDFAPAQGQVVLFLDLVNRLTPLAALQAVTQLVTNGPTPPGTEALPIGH